MFYRVVSIVGVFMGSRAVRIITITRVVTVVKRDIER